MEIRPLGANVVIEPHDGWSISHGGIHIPDAARKNHRETITAKVIAVGPGRSVEGVGRIPVEVGAGDVVYLRKWVGEEVVVDGRRLIVVPETELLASMDVNAKWSGEQEV